MNWSLLRGACRLVIGGLLLASALGKSLDLPGFLEVLVTYRAIPEPLLWPVALTITGLEWLLGVWLLSGWRLGTAALATLILYVGYTIWMTLSLVRGLDLPNCGCYGVFFAQPLRWYSPLEDAVVAGMCYALWKSTRGTRTPH